ncbi:MAG TPA: TolC family protein [Bryobacteraceae bacterium]|nr:TolC family protein [Bryobacteraceae bacterium]
MKLTILLFTPLIAFSQNSSSSADDLLQDVRTRSPLALQTFQQYATASNPTLQQAQSYVKQSAALSHQAGLYPNPSVGYQGEQIRGGSYGGGEQGAFVQQNIVLGGKLRLRRNVFEQQRREDEFTLAEQRYRIQGDVGQSFYAALAAQEIVNVRQRLLVLARDAVETAHQLANVGQADAPDVLQAEVEADQAAIDYTKAQRTFLQSFAELSALAGQPNLPVSPLQGDLEHPAQIDTAKLPESTLRDSPEVKRARQALLHAQAELKSARRESIPDLQLRGGVQQNSEPLSPLTVGVQGFATVGVSLPIFNRNQGNVAAAQAEVERAHSELNRLELRLRQSIQVPLQAYLSGRFEADRYRDQMIPRAEGAYHLYLAKYRQMGAAYPQVLISQRTLFQLQVGYINALASVWMNSIALQNYLLSSGLSSPDVNGSYTTTVNTPNTGINQ